MRVRGGRTEGGRTGAAGHQTGRIERGMRAWLLDNLGLKLLSVFLAVFLWAVVLGEQKVEVTVNIPLELNLPKNLILMNEPPDNLEVRLRGPKTLATTLAPREVVLNSVPTKFNEGENIVTI